jgi:hypothetical protein
MVTPADKRDVYKAMQEIFDKAAKERKVRGEFVKDPLETRFSWTVPAWVLFERAALHKAVNEERARRNLPPVDIKAIDRVERLATGHVDYATKYTLYCTEIALGENDPRA